MVERREGRGRFWTSAGASGERRGPGGKPLWEVGRAVGARGCSRAGELRVRLTIEIEFRGARVLCVDKSSQSVIPGSTQTPARARRGFPTTTKARIAGTTQRTGSRKSRFVCTACLPARSRLHIIGSQRWPHTGPRACVGHDLVAELALVHAPPNAGMMCVDMMKYSIRRRTDFAFLLQFGRTKDAAGVRHLEQEGCRDGCTV